MFWILQISYDYLFIRSLSLIFIRERSNSTNSLNEEIWKIWLTWLIPESPMELSIHHNTKQQSIRLNFKVSIFSFISPSTRQKTIIQNPWLSIAFPRIIVIISFFIPEKSKFWSTGKRFCFNTGVKYMIPSEFSFASIPSPHLL